MASKKKQKSVDEYRRDIYTLKNKLKQEQQYLEELKQKHSDLDIFGEEGYTYSIKMKILEYNLTDIKQKMQRYSKDPATKFYDLNFATYALIKACEIIGISKQMVYRGVDIESKNIVNWFNFSNFLKQTLRLDVCFVTPIMKVLDPQETTQIPKSRYLQYLSVFMMETEKINDEQLKINECVARVCKLLVKFEVDPAKIWKEKQINIATCAYGIQNKVQQADSLDCIAVYCKCDPKKQGMISGSIVINMLEHKIKDVKTFREGDKFKLSKKL